MFDGFFKGKFDGFLKGKKVNELKEKCARELEIKYTKKLTLEFCLSWVSSHLMSLGQSCVLECDESEVDDNIFRFRLHVVEDDDSHTDGVKSLCCCVIFALDVEPILKNMLDEGDGVYVFNR